MEATGFPTSADIYLELDGRKIAVVQGYTARASKSSQSVEAFGESEPVATIEGQRKYTLELTRLNASCNEICVSVEATPWIRRIPSKIVRMRCSLSTQ